MIGSLPTTLEVEGKEYPIRTDYRDCLVILQAMGDPELTEWEKIQVLMEILYIDLPPMCQEAIDNAIDFLDCGKKVSKNHSKNPQLYDWEQDEQMIFSAINKVAGQEVRSLDYMHLWTFYGLFNEIGEGTFSTVISIRNKKSKGKKLEKWEQEFYKNNRETIDLKRKYTEADINTLGLLDEILGQKKG